MANQTEGPQQMVLMARLVADHIPGFDLVKFPLIREVLNCSAEDAVVEYSVWGGVPLYKEKKIIPCLFLKNKPADSVANKIFFPADVLNILKN